MPRLGCYCWCSGETHGIPRSTIRSTRRRRMKLRSALMASAMLALPLAAANAQPVNGPYISLGVGANIMQKEPITQSGRIHLNDTNLQTNLGGAASVAAGWGFGNGIRAELEFPFRYNSLQKIRGSNNSSSSVGGSEQKYGPMVNVLYDFNDITPIVVPYVGLGVGYQLAQERIDNFNGPGANFNKAEGAFAYQAILGAAFPISQMPGLAFTAEYKFMGLAGDRTYHAS